LIEPPWVDPVCAEPVIEMAVSAGVILANLGLDSRVQAAALAYRSDLNRTD